MRSFVERYPKDPLAGNAQYWLGETFYVRKDYSNAATAFAQGYEKYPKGAKASDDLLKLGMSLTASSTRSRMPVRLMRGWRTIFPSPPTIDQGSRGRGEAPRQLLSAADEHGARYRDGRSASDFVTLRFTEVMARLAPFETRPHLAVAVSGGSDSMALTLLANDWARRRGGKATAVTVDHGLRPEAAGEAAQVAAWCAARGIDHAILRWTGPAPRSGIQAAARAARYALLESWCREHRVLHLLLAHQRDDQAETVKMRDARSSGMGGLAGMASVSERGAVRLLRPLLAVSRVQLRAFLLTQGQRWIDDPSNRNPAFTRVRIRAALGETRSGSSDAYLAATAGGLAGQRAALEAADARRLARWLTVHPAGFAWLDPAAFADRDGWIRRRSARSSP